MRRHRVYDAWNNVVEVNKYCHAGNNVIRVVWEHGQEFDGLRSAIYVKKAQ